MCPNRICSVNELEEVFMRIGGILRNWEYEKKFFKTVVNLDNSILKILLKQIEKIFNNPKVGTCMRSNRKGQREVYVTKRFRLYYSFSEKDNKVVFLEFSHKKAQ